MARFAGAFIMHPHTQMVIALILAAIALTGKMSLTFADILLILAFLVGCEGIVRARYKISRAIGLCLAFGVSLLLFSFWIGSPAKDTNATSVMPTPPFPQIQLTGNLGQRAIELSHRIMEDLFMHGWRPMHPEFWPEFQNAKPLMEIPTNPEEYGKWLRFRSLRFRFQFRPHVLDLRHEFAELHFRDDQLDDFLKSEGVLEDDKKLSGAPGRSEIGTERPLMLIEIEEVAVSLRHLAVQLPKQPQ
jgi:hypothetical protein